MKNMSLLFEHNPGVMKINTNQNIYGTVRFI